MQNNDAREAQPKAAEPNEFETVKARLEEIAHAVDDESISLDDALDLYEEAVKLGLKASDLLEVGIVVEEEQADETGSGAAAGSGDEPDPTATASAVAAGTGAAVAEITD